VLCAFTRSCAHFSLALSHLTHSHSHSPRRLYYGASKLLVSKSGKTARDYAVSHKNKAIIDLFDEDADDGKGDTDVAASAVDADGLTSTQRNKAKKRALKEAETRGMLAAVASRDPDDAAADTASTSSDSSSALAPLLKPAPAATWPEVASAGAGKRFELKVDRSEAAVAAAALAAATGGDAVSSLTLPGGALVDPAIWHLSLLNRLELRVPALGSVPSALGHLTALTTLIVRRCNLTHLPDQLSLLVDLKFLDASENALTELPVALGGLKKLEVLDVSGNALTVLGPASLLTSLTSLSADRNQLTAVDLNWAGLSRLGHLSVSNNALTTLPEAIGTPQLLEVLNVADNQLTSLPLGLADLKEKKIREVSTRMQQ
jgi:hypothetical protein